MRLAKFQKKISATPNHFWNFASLRSIMRNFVNDIAVKSGLTNPKSEDFLKTDTKEKSKKVG
jgi:hypothetical protein